jgi:hypothetical protein
MVLTNVMSTTDTQGSTQFVCAGWAMSGNEPASGVDTQVVMTVTNDAVLTWLWTTNYQLTTAAGPYGSVLPTTSWQAFGSNVEITATADAYYHFTTWDGDALGNTNPLFLLMDGPKSVTAYFQANMTTNKPTPEWWLAKYGITNDFEEAVTNDVDEDGVPTGDEYVMNTDPTNELSYLRLIAIGLEKPAKRSPGHAQRIACMTCNTTWEIRAMAGSRWRASPISNRTPRNCHYQRAGRECAETLSNQSASAGK